MARRTTPFPLLTTLLALSVTPILTSPSEPAAPGAAAPALTLAPAEPVAPALNPAPAAPRVGDGVPLGVDPGVPGVPGVPGDTGAAGTAVGAFGPVEPIIEPACRFTRTTAAVAVGADGVPRGFATVAGGTCGEASVIRYFERDESDWVVVDTPWRGAVVAAAADVTGTFLLYQAVDGALWITRRLADGSVEGGRRISAVAGRGQVEGDLVAKDGRWWALWSERLAGARRGVAGLVQARTIGPDIGFQRVSHPLVAADVEPSLALRPDGGVTMAWSRRALGATSSELWVGTVEADARRRARRFEFGSAGRRATNQRPDVFVQGARTYLAWRRDAGVVVADNPGGSWRLRAFMTAAAPDAGPGDPGPSLATSYRRVFVAWTSAGQPPGAFMTERAGTAWSGAPVSPPTPYRQRVIGVVAAGARATVLMASPTRLYARLQLSP